MTDGPNADELIDAARTETGLEDFGPETFREGLGILCTSIAEDAQLNELGGFAVGDTLLAALRTRLRVVEWARTDPEVADEPIDSPIVVIGMFRAGTTLLGQLLDQDPGNRSLLRWESADPVPPPTPAIHRTGPRVEAAQVAVEMLDQLNPAMRGIHHEDADGPTECISVMSQDFKSLSWEAITNVPAYGRWLLEVDQQSAYEYHRQVLQILQSGGVRGRWTLKSPHHAIALEALTAVYPDARLVLLHRDPVVLCASVCSLISTLSGTFSDADHTAYIAEHWTAMLEESVHRIDAFRAAHPEHSITDVQYSDLVRDPGATVRAIYRACGDELSDDAASAISRYGDAHPKGALGSHRYDVTEFGLDPAVLTERFAGYITRYEVPTEDQPA